MGCYKKTRKKTTLHYYVDQEGHIYTTRDFITYESVYYNEDNSNDKYLGEFKTVTDFVRHLATRGLVSLNSCGWEHGFSVDYLSKKLCLDKEKILKIRKECGWTHEQKN